MSKTDGTARHLKAFTPKKITGSAPDNLHHLAFENSIQANIIERPGTGKIIIANMAACRLLGYTKKELLTRRRSDIVDIKEPSFKKMMKDLKSNGHSTVLVTMIKKNGTRIPCQITSAIFKDVKGIENSVVTITDMTLHIRSQKNIDAKKEKIIANNIALVQSKQKSIDTRNAKTVAANIALAILIQKNLDTRNAKIVARNIVIAISKQIQIDAIKEKIVTANIALAISRQKNIDAGNAKKVAADIVLAISKQIAIDESNAKIVADNIALAISEQKRIDTKKEKIVADNIILALEKSDEEKINYENATKEKLEHEIRMKEIQIEEAMKEAKETERSDIGRELHDNINQLLGASKMYLEMAKQGGTQSGFFLGRSSEYTLKAIEEIRKLTKGLTTDIIKNLGLGEAINNITHDTMELTPVKILYTAKGFIESSVNDKFKLNILRIVQEHLNNILKHAKATKVLIRLSQNKKAIMLSLTDNGIGFDTRKKAKGIGIANIKSRAASYKGTADFVSQTGQGCVLTVNFPMSSTTRLQTG